MIVNGEALLLAAPIKDMMREKVRGPLTSHGLAEAGYDIRIKQDILFMEGEVRVDGAWSDGNFALASAIEEFDMPHNLVGVVHDKSTWARKRLSVFNTVIEPGFFGGLTLELVFHGVGPLHIPAGSGIAQVIFHQTVMRAAYDGKYNGQSTDPTPAIDG
jgi:dCTP deaminase